jgi:DNA-binding phage protein
MGLFPTMEKDFTKFLRKKLDQLHKDKVFTNKKKLALDGGLGESAVYDALNERSQSPKLSTVEGIAKGLNIQLWKLLYDVSELAEDEEIRQSVLQGEELLSLYSRLDDVDREWVIGKIRSVLDVAEPRREVADLLEEQNKELS